MLAVLFSALMASGIDLPALGKAPDFSLTNHEGAAFASQLSPAARLSRPPPQR